MPAHTFTQSAALVQVCTPVENNSELWRSQTLDVSNSSPKHTASTSSEEKSCQGSWNKLDCFHPTVRRQRKPVKKGEREIQQVRKQRLSLSLLPVTSTLPLQGLADVELILFTASHTVLSFALMARTALLTHWCFGCWQTVLAQRQGFLTRPITQKGWERTTPGWWTPNDQRDIPYVWKHAWQDKLTERRRNEDMILMGSWWIRYYAWLAQPSFCFPC